MNIINALVAFVKQLTQGVKKYLDTHPEVRSALRVFVYTFIAMFSLSLLGFLADVQDWASSDNLDFPSVAPLGKALAAALASSLAGLFSFVYNKLPRTATAQYPVK